jgi:2-C-methyl-D-erythritol 4-phosphate cytidylyltransferase
MHKYALIVAGGSGKRMNNKVPKQFLELLGKPVLMHTINAFRKYDSAMEIVLVLPVNKIEHWFELCKKHEYTVTHAVAEGGKTRFHSVKNGLSYFKHDGLIAIHDGVRPFVSQKTISTCFDIAQKKGNAVPVMPLTESIRSIVEEYSRPIDRSNLRLVQTPQVFQHSILKEAYLQDYHEDFTDDASVIEKIRHRIHVVEGNPENIKITTPYDMLVAEYLVTLKRD